MLSVGKAQLGRSARGLQHCFPVEFRRVILCESVLTQSQEGGRWVSGSGLFICDCIHTEKENEFLPLEDVTVTSRGEKL